MLIGLDRDMTAIDIEVIRSKVKFRSITFVQKWFLLIILRTVSHMLVGLVNGLNPIDFIS